MCKHFLELSIETFSKKFKNFEEMKQSSYARLVSKLEAVCCSCGQPSEEKIELIHNKLTHNLCSICQFSEKACCQFCPDKHDLSKELKEKSVRFDNITTNKANIEEKETKVKEKVEIFEICDDFLDAPVITSQRNGINKEEESVKNDKKAGSLSENKGVTEGKKNESSKQIEDVNAASISKKKTIDYTKSCCVCCYSTAKLEEVSNKYEILGVKEAHLICVECSKKFLKGDEPTFNCYKCKKQHKTVLATTKCCSVF